MLEVDERQELMVSRALGGMIGIETDFDLTSMQQLVVIYQHNGDQTRYATLLWHEKEPYKEVHDVTLRLRRDQWDHLSERLRVITEGTPAAQAEREDLTRLQHRIEIVEAENALLRENLADFRTQRAVP